MNLDQRMGRVALAITLAMAGTIFAQATPPTNGGTGGTGSDIQAQLQAIRAQVSEQQALIETQQRELQHLRGTQQEAWLNERRAAEVKALVKEVLADADTRASLADHGMTAGHNGKNFFLASEDGSFLLNIKGQLQARYSADFRHDSQDFKDSKGVVQVPADNATEGFVLRRMKLFFTGFIGSPKVEYWVQMAANKDTTAVEMEAAYVSYNFTEGLRVWGGRFVDPLLRDNFTSGGNQLAAERAALSYIFASNEDYVEGVGVEWKPCDAFKLRGTVNDGIASGNTGGAATGFLNGGNDAQNDATDIGVTARADVKLAGDWKQMDDYTAWSGEPLAVFLGAAIHYERGETGDRQAHATTSVTGPYDGLLLWTADGSVEVGGFNVYAAAVGMHVHGTELNSLGDIDNYGAMIQAGYQVIPDKLEPFVRYEWIGIDGDIATDDLNILTLGANYYIKRHTVKFTADAVWFMDPVTQGNTLGALGSSGAGLSGIGALPDAPEQDGQVLLRVQVQLLF